MGKKLFVGNLSFQTTDGELQEVFEQYGEVEDAKIILDRETGRSRGFGFVTFLAEEDAEKALAMDGQEVNGRSLRVNFATDRGEGGGGGGGGRRGGRGYGGGYSGRDGGGYGGGRDGGGRDGGGYGGGRDGGRRY